MVKGPPPESAQAGLLPVTKIAIGLAIAFVALRINGFDLLLDPVGWGLCASGLAQLRRSADDGFDRAHGMAVAMVWVEIASFTLSIAGPSDSPVRRAVGALIAAGALAAVWLVADPVVRRVRSGGDASRAALLDVLRWAVVALGWPGVLAEYGYAALGPVVTVACFATVLSLIVVLYASAGLASLSPGWSPDVPTGRPAS
ncbi:hypothetical protein HTZ77_01205 [Nonomuraea sp. SMC257]|uniref:Uncharacterized protein n=1 Tax=Nonomuraea montanisoli TaxID=2741721 RepID=A0A7Y6I3W1_9ACTN|nr:hypothetical protein [Nonomuraea montanisoli]NUW30054.1 hypothetical protein [Nonomuraea montanisoli]